VRVGQGGHLGARMWVRVAPVHGEATDPSVWARQRSDGAAILLFGRSRKWLPPRKAALQRPA
jgi:hypothetical protein